MFSFACSLQALVLHLLLTFFVETFSLLLLLLFKAPSTTRSFLKRSRSQKGCVFLSTFGRSSLNAEPKIDHKRRQLQQQTEITARAMSLVRGHVLSLKYNHSHGEDY